MGFFRTGRFVRFTENGGRPHRMGAALDPMARTLCGCSRWSGNCRRRDDLDAPDLQWRKGAPTAQCLPSIYIRPPPLPAGGGAASDTGRPANQARPPRVSPDCGIIPRLCASKPDLQSSKEAYRIPERFGRSGRKGNSHASKNQLTNIGCNRRVENRICCKSFHRTPAIAVLLLRNRPAFSFFRHKGPAVKANSDPGDCNWQ